MSLTDIMSAMRLSQYPAIALVIFLAAFAAILLHALTKRGAEVEHEASMPLHDGLTRSESEPGTQATGYYTDAETATLSVGARKGSQPRSAAPQGSER